MEIMNRDLISVAVICPDEVVNGSVRAAFSSCGRICAEFFGSASAAVERVFFENRGARMSSGQFADGAPEKYNTGNVSAVPCSDAQWDAVLIDDSTESLYEKVIPSFASIPVVVMVPPDSRAAAYAIKNGACDFLFKDDSFGDLLVSRIICAAVLRGGLPRWCSGMQKDDRFVASNILAAIQDSAAAVLHNVNNLLAPLLLNMSKVEMFIETDRLEDLKREFPQMVRKCESHVAAISETLRVLKEVALTDEKEMEKWEGADFKQVIKNRLDLLKKK